MARALRVVRSSFGRVALLEMTTSLTTHSHPQLHVITKLGGADGRFEVSGESVPLTDCQAVVCNSWEPHAYQHGHRGEATLVLACYLEPLWLTCVLGLEGFGCARRQRSLRLDPSLVKCFHHLAFDTLVRNDRAEEHAPELMAALVRELRDAFSADGPDERIDLETKAADRRLASVIRHMREHMEDRIDLDDIASRFGLSRAHLYHLFRERIGVPPHVCWNAMRMEHALEHLGQKRPLAIKRLAYDLGFNSQGNFTRFFHSIQGVSPRAYQQAASGCKRR